ncbi:MAG TPA: aminotransferase class III-fold pyridoxal phosphate-dependent enzyme, partial [Planctomycetaceae bacterium]|nr:aminotransferase class III-fold pyridoxal phosphate-dependent enzyme [Planctomycetaceae bacterium]
MIESHDAEYFAEHLRGFVPPASFDAHAHLYRSEDALDTLPRHVEEESGDVGWAAYVRALRSWMGDRHPADGLFFTVPKPTLDRPQANRFVADQVRSRPGSRLLLLVHPEDDPQAIEATAESVPCAGLKVYHVYSGRSDSFDAPPDQFLPEWAWQLAHEHEWILMLHLVRSRALADPVNHRYVRDRCRRYPRARLILAHAARGFCGAHTVEAVATLRGLENVYFDTSGICEPHPLEAILRTFGPRRLLFGTDFSVSELRGRCVSVGDGFLWLYEHNVDWQGSQFAQPLRIGLESLLALKQACRTLRLTDSDVERIFCSNAHELLGLSRPARSVQAVYRRAKQLIPGGTQLLSKRPEMYAPDRWPAYFAEARGCEVIDLDGRRYWDLTTSGIGSCLLGYADPDVNAAVLRRVEFGSMCTLNSPDEVELAELLIALHPWADRVRFGRTGGESMAVAVRIARAHSGRDRVAFCGYHG